MAGESIDGHKLVYHPDKVAQWLASGDTFPVHIEIGTTSRCNHKCVFCALDWVSHKYDIERDVLGSALEDMGRNGVRSVMFGGEGEPLLHKDIGYFVRHAKDSGIDVAITTNGANLDEKLQEECLPYLTWIKFSVDAGNAESYSRVHGVRPENYELLMKNIERSVKTKKENGLEVTIGTQFLAIPPSIKSGPELAKRLSSLGVDYLSIKPYSHHPGSGNDFALSKEDYNATGREMLKHGTSTFKIIFRDETAKRIEEGNTYPKCYGLPFISLIDSKGNILPCNLFYEQDDFSYGNLHDKSFNEIWLGEQRKNVLKKIKDKGTKDCRLGCRCDVINRYLHRLKNPLSHDNFT